MVLTKGEKCDFQVCLVKLASAIFMSSHVVEACLVRSPTVLGYLMIKTRQGRLLSDVDHLHLE